MKGTNQSDDTMWKEIMEYSKSKFIVVRTPVLIEIKVVHYEEDVTHYLAAKEHVMNGNNSGGTEEE